MTQAHDRAGGGRLVVLTVLALIAFAANSILCRMALLGERFDPISFTVLRIFSGAIFLLLLARSRGTRAVEGGSWPAALSLAVYAGAFSFAYLELSAGTGALILFGTVQLTMVGFEWGTGKRPRLAEVFGMGIALTGLVALVWPGLTAPSPLGAGLMGLSGVAWGVYSLCGRGAKEPALATTDNFLRALAFVGPVGVLLCYFVPLRVSLTGALLAVLSGAITSGLGYVIWYWVLPRLGATRAAILQLASPVLVAVGGVLILSEEATSRLVLSSVVLLSGVGLAVIGRGRR